MKLFSQGVEGQPIPVDEIFREALTFFDRLNQQLKTGDPQEQKEALAMMKEMHAKIAEQLKKIAANTGMSEEQLASFAENPGNFSTSEWMAMQQARTKMGQVGQNLAKSVKSLTEGQGAPPAEPPKKPEGVKKKPDSKRVKRSDWNRS